MRQRRRSGRRTLGLLLIPVLAAAIPPLAASQASHSTQAKHIPLAWFEDVTHKAGIVFRHHTRRFNNPYAEIMQGYTRLGAAAAVADYDRDGFEDIFVTDSCTTCKNHLYHNNEIGRASCRERG